MDSRPSKADVEARIQAATERMSDRMDDIQDEVSSTGGAVRDWMANNPVKSVGAMLGAGLVVGWTFGREASGPSAREDRSAEALIEALRAGADEGEISEEAPLVVYVGGEEEERQSGLLRSLFGTGAQAVFHTAFNLLARDAVESLLADADLEEVLGDASPFE